MSREGRRRDTEPLLGDTAETRSLGTVRTKQQRIAELARKHPQRSFRSLAHHIDVDWLEEAYRRTRKDGASGVDGQTAQVYSQNLTEHLEDLLNRAKSGRYQAPPVRRPQPVCRGSTRPAGRNRLVLTAVGNRSIQVEPEIDTGV